jgi:adenylate cyclase
MVALAASLAFCGGMKAAGLVDLADSGIHDGAVRRYASRLGKVSAAEEEKLPLLVLVDQYSLTWVQNNLGLSWPWPRELYGLMAGFFRQAKVQVYDILFTETSPYGPEDDVRCAKAMDDAGNVVLAEARVPSVPRDTRVLESEMRLSPLPLEKAWFGSVKAILDSDGVVRKYGIRYDENGESRPSLALAALQKAGEAGGDIEARESAPIRFRGASPSLPALNAAQVIEAALAPAELDTPRTEGGLEPADFADRYVFIGFSAPGLLDRQAVPTDSAMPGVEIHATFVADYLGKGLLKTPRPLALGSIQGLFIAGASVMATWVSSAPLLALGGAFFVLAPLGFAYAAYAAGLAFPSGFLLLGGLSAFFIGISLSYLAEGRTRRFLRKSFSQYLAADVIDELVKDPSRLRLGGEARIITAFFSDIRDFTTLSEGMDPARLSTFMNKYLSIVTDKILEEGGTVDKYVGDAVVAFWNAPLERPDHANRAVLAALRCQRALKGAQEEFAALGSGFPFTRIGIHTGVAIVGNMGSPARFNYTALGDVMNTASRLESANKSLGTSILVSRETVAACVGDFEEVNFRALGRIAVKGKAKEIEVWEARLQDEVDEVPRVEPWDGVRPC